MSVRYVVHGGSVRSQNDGDWVHVSPSQVARLYNLRPGTWLPAGTVGFRWTEETISLYPLENGDYRLSPSVKVDGYNEEPGTAVVPEDEQGVIS